MDPKYFKTNKEFTLVLILIIIFIYNEVAFNQSDSFNATKQDNKLQYVM